MPVVVGGEIFDLLPSPRYNIKIARNAPKISFQSANGYKHQRERYSHARRTYGVEYVLTQEQLNTLDNWLDNTGSDTFWWLPHESVWKDSAAPTVRLVRITSESIQYGVVLSGSAPGGPLYSVSFDMEEV